MKKQKKISATKFWIDRQDKIKVARNTFISYLSRFGDELTEKGIIEIEPRGLKVYYYILDEKALKKFFKDKGIYVFND